MAALGTDWKKLEGAGCLADDDLDMAAPPLHRLRQQLGHLHPVRGSARRGRPPHEDHPLLLRQDTRQAAGPRAASSPTTTASRRGATWCSTTTTPSPGPAATTPTATATPWSRCSSATAGASPRLRGAGTGARLEAPPDRPRTQGRPRPVVPRVQPPGQRVPQGGHGADRRAAGGAAVSRRTSRPKSCPTRPTTPTSTRPT